ncbi:MAG: exopolysaccharide biosynthesis protein [Calothrix sp. SM1_7_51]|nr:exopolysaccharide biosynthesis protein [Calothrix sp. SM1_7_51]
MAKISAIVTKHWKVLFGWNVLVGLVGTGAIARVPKIWSASTQLIMPGRGSNLDANLGELGYLRNSEPNFYSSQFNALKLQEAILNSDAVLKKVQELDPQGNEFSELGQYKSLFNVSLNEETSIISLTVSAANPELARLRASNLIQAYQQRLNQLRQTNKTARQQLSRNELEAAKQNLRNLQLALARFKQSSGLVDSQSQTQGIVTTINNLTSTQAEALAQAKYSENQANVLANRLNISPPEAIDSLELGENKDYQFIRSKIAELDVEIKQKQAIYTDEHPSIQNLMTQRQQLQNQMEKYVNQVSQTNKIDTNVNSDKQGRASLIQQMLLAESEASSNRKKAAQIQSKLQQLQANLSLIPNKQAKLAELIQQVELAEGVYKGLVAQVQQTNIDSFDSYPNVQLLEAPKIELKASSPKIILTLLNAVLASFIGSAAMILLLERRNPLLSPKDLQNIKFPIVVPIPKLSNSAIKHLLNETDIEFQRLASAISLQSLEDRRLLITSAIAGEGKTSVTIGLATALVELGFRVLVVDGNFRQGELSKYLSKYLSYGREISNSERPLPIKANLDLLPNFVTEGKILDFVNQGRFEKALAFAQLRGEYDYVLVDSAAVSTTSETALMTSVVTNVLFVVRPGNSYTNSVNYSLEQLINHKANIVGLVVNSTESISGLVGIR